VRVVDLKLRKRKNMARVFRECRVEDGQWK
jgi:hypothetical protein